jgi:hypothetical protein
VTGDRPCRLRPVGGQDLVHPGQGLLAERPRQPPPTRRHPKGGSPRAEPRCRARDGRSRHPCRLAAEPDQQPGSRHPSATAQRASTPGMVGPSCSSSGWPPEPVKEATQTMRIMAVCNNCHRELQLSQVVEGPQITGRCLWCGTLLLRTTPCSSPTPSGGPSALGQSSPGPCTARRRLSHAADPARVCP